MLKVVPKRSGAETVARCFLSWLLHLFFDCIVGWGCSSFEYQLRSFSTAVGDSLLWFVSVWHVYFVVLLVEICLETCPPVIEPCCLAGKFFLFVCGLVFDV